MDELLIGEVARRAGLRPSTVRYYEQMGLLPPPRRVNGRRRYNPEVVQALAVIQFAQTSGFTLAELKTHWHYREDGVLFSDALAQAMRAKLRELDALITEVEQMKQTLGDGLACECRKVDDCVILGLTWQPDNTRQRTGVQPSVRYLRQRTRLGRSGGSFGQQS